MHHDNDKELADEDFIAKMEKGGSTYLFSGNSKFIPPSLFLILNIIQTVLIGLLNPIILISSILLVWYTVIIFLKFVIDEFKIPFLIEINKTTFKEFLNLDILLYAVPSLLLIGILGYYFLGSVFRLRIYQFFNKILILLLSLLFFTWSVIFIDDLSDGLVRNDNFDFLVSFFKSILTSGIGRTLILSFLIVYLVIWLVTSPVGQWIIGKWKSKEDFSESLIYKWCAKIRFNEVTNNIGIFLLYVILIIIILGTYNLDGEYGPILDKHWVLAIHLLLLMILLGFVTNINSTSLGRFYADSVARAFGCDQSLRLSDLHHNEKKGASIAPYPLINCCLNLAPEPKAPNLTSDYYLLSPLYMGSYATGYIKPASEITLTTAMRTSGAAINTGMGLFSNSIAGLLIGLLNFRTGTLLFNPLKYKERINYLKSLSRQGTPKIFQRIKEFIDLISLHYFPSLTWWPRFYAKSLFTNNSIEDTLLDISDGGHLENLAAIELLRRKCKLIICFDNGIDLGYEFEDLKYLMKRARIEMDIELRFREGSNPFTEIKPTIDSDWLSRKRFGVADILEYKRDTNGDTIKDEDGKLSTTKIGTFVFVKLALLKNLSPFKGAKKKKKVWITRFINI